MNLNRTSSVCGVILLLLGACSDATGPADQLEVVVGASAAIVTVEQPIVITVTVINKGTRTARVSADTDGGGNLGLSSRPNPGLDPGESRDAPAQ